MSLEHCFDEVTSAMEINHRVSQAVEVVRYKGWSRAKSPLPPRQLQMAFLGNEYHPALQGLPRDEKEKVGDYLTKLEHSFAKSIGSPRF